MWPHMFARRHIRYLHIVTLYALPHTACTICISVYTNSTIYTSQSDAAGEPVWKVSGLGSRAKGLGVGSMLLGSGLRG